MKHFPIYFMWPMLPKSYKGITRKLIYKTIYFMNKDASNISTVLASLKLQYVKRVIDLYKVVTISGKQV